MYKATFKLKQHTPIIHFQHDQKGATLRATELKPKLDKFLFSLFSSQGLDYNGFLIKNSTEPALDYKVRVDIDLKKSEVFDIETKILKYKQRENREVEDILKFPCFFGSMGHEGEKKFTFNTGVITITIISFYEELDKQITNNFPSFISVTNFGTRQSKGFGCFELLDNEVANNGSYQFRVDDDNQVNNSLKRLTDFTEKGLSLHTKFFSLFKSIELFWKVARTGYNDGGGARFNNPNSGNYIKAALYFYMRDIYDPHEKYQWDKKSIKSAFFNRKAEEQKHFWNNDKIFSAYDGIGNGGNKLLVRDVLGLATSSDWLSYNKSTITKQNDDVERFKSPITIKPYWNEKYQNWTCKIIINNIDSSFLGKTFTITNSTGGAAITLETPTNFNLMGYFTYLEKHYIPKLIKLEPQIISYETRNHNQIKSYDIQKIIEVFNSFQSI